MKISLDSIIDAGLEALDGDDLEAAQRALDEAIKLAGENHRRVLHLSGMLAWAEGRVDNAAGYLMQAVDQGAEEPEIYLDCAECLFLHGDDLDQAEAIIRALLERPGLSQEAKDEAHLLLAQVRLDDDDAEEARELLEAVSDETRGHVAFLSTYGAVMMALGRDNDAVAALEKAVDAAPDDADLAYQLGLTRAAVGDHAGAAEAMLRVLELDGAELDNEPVTEEEEQELRAGLEDVLEELPDPILRMVSSAPISVQTRPTTDQVRGGVNPRGVLAFLGRPKTDDTEADLAGIAVMRDLLIDAIDDDDEIPEALVVGLLEEVRRFFREESLGMANIEE
ncbi:MAG: tetratricopeptide repeat protein [Nannocystis sp.]|nr:tetratricopeptide repeat protein [Nannocystis sp.]